MITLSNVLRLIMNYLLFFFFTNNSEKKGFFLLENCVTCNRGRRLSVQPGAHNDLRKRVHYFICIITVSDVKDIAYMLIKRVITTQGL